MVVTAPSPFSEPTLHSTNTGVGGPNPMTHRKLIALDFDGVLHSYSTPWSDAATISDGPTPGAMRFLQQLVDDGRFDVVIVSSRLSRGDGYDAVHAWLLDNLRAAFNADEDESTGDLGEAGDVIFHKLKLSPERPPAFVTIDDRGLNFTGEWPDLDTLAALKPWNKRSEAYVSKANDKPIAFASTSRERDLAFTLALVRERLQGALQSPIYASEILELAIANIDEAIRKRERTT